MFSWWGMSPVDRFATCEMLKHTGGSLVNSEKKDLWQAVLWVTGYYIWKNRNAQMFKNKRDSVLRAFHEEQLRARLVEVLGQVLF